MNPRTDPVPAGLPAHEYERLVKLLELHYALPLAYPLAGAIFEELFANAVGGQCEKKKLLFDVLRGATGWSLKTVQVARANVRPGATFEAVIQRCNILTDAAVSARSPAPVLGERILSHFNYFCERSSAAQNIIDPRVAFLVRDKAQRNFLFFQQRFRPYATDEVTWRWANDA